MADGMQKNWRELCVAVTNETDSTRLTSLVQELIEALDRGERRWRHPTPTPDAIQRLGANDLRSFSCDIPSENPPQR